jgi:prepilin-type N-terminal cleavage/methylation domain-containing protein
MIGHRIISRRTTSRRRGFTLIEASLATVIIGVGVVAMMTLLASGTVNNIESAELTTGVNIAKNIREVAVQKSMAQLVAMNGTYHEPPWDSRSIGITDLPDWRQIISVQAVNPDNLTTNISTSTPRAVRVTVTVTHHGQSVCDLNWYTFNPS